MLNVVNDLGMLFPKSDSKRKVRYLEVLCDCGCIFKIQAKHLKNVPSCKNCSYTRMKEISKTHGESNNGLYTSWKAMKSRCLNINNKDYKYYGLKGITVCDNWKDYQSFAAWARDNGWEENLTIDRINSSKNYDPDNCRWLTRSDNAGRKFNEA